MCLKRELYWGRVTVLEQGLGDLSVVAQKLFSLPLSDT